MPIPYTSAMQRLTAELPPAWIAFATGYPACKASRLRPIEALRFE